MPKRSDRCNSNQIIPFVEKAANDNDFQIKRRDEKEKNRFHFYIFDKEETKNDENDEIIEEEEEVNDAVFRSYSFYRKKIFFFYLFIYLITYHISKAELITNIIDMFLLLLLYLFITYDRSIL